ncbi:MAG: delta-60 repeat domain-containing protein [Candidatus Chromulinivorax sp.]
MKLKVILYQLFIFLWYLHISLDASYNLNPGYGQGAGYTGIGNVWHSSTTTATIKQSDDKLIIAGYAQVSSNASPEQIALVRFLADGSLDTNFANQGHITLNLDVANGYQVQARAQSIAIDNLNRIIVAGYAYNSAADNQANLIIARFLEDGTPDTTFGIQNTIGITGLMPTTPQSSGYVGSVAGSSNGDDGSLGYITLLLNNQLAAYAVIIEPDNKIVITGQTGNNAMIVARFLEHGALDTLANGGSGFGIGNGLGQLTNDVLGYIVGDNLGIGALAGYALTQSSLGQILIAGANSTENGQMMLVRLTSLGRVDTNFNTPYGYTITSNIVNCNQNIAKVIQIQANDDIVIAGNAYNYITNSYAALSARYTADGLLQTEYGNGNGYVTTLISNYPTINISGITYNQNDQIIVSGYVSAEQRPTASIIIRYNQNGDLDRNFSSTGYILANQNIPANSAIGISMRQDFTLILGATIQDGLNMGSINFFGPSFPTTLQSMQSYGLNVNLFEQFLYVNNYAELITDPIVQQALINGVKQAISFYIETYGSIQNFNFIGYLYLLAPILDTQETTLVEEYPGFTIEISNFFLQLNNRIKELIIEPQ